MSELKGESKAIWDEIKDLDLELFGLPLQPLNKYCNPVMINSDQLYITSSTSMVLAVLEEKLSKSFNIESAGKFWVIGRKQ